MKSDWSIENDYEDILNGVGTHWSSLKDSNIFITGGTGFIGRWLLSSLNYANARLDLGVRATILTRNPRVFCEKFANISENTIFSIVPGDVRSFEFPDGKFTHLIHAATDASADLNLNNPYLMFETIIQGTARALDFAADKNIERILNLSSGAVYGAQPPEVAFLSEDSRLSPDCTNSLNAYAEGKRAAEMICAIYAKMNGLNISTARIFAVIGPYISLDTHFAAGNFIKDAIEGRKIIVKSSGSAIRSYLYASDLTTMLWHLLIRGPSGKSYNIGSQEPISIAELAQKTSTLVGSAGYEIQGKDDPGWNPGRYVPDVSLLREDLGLSPQVSLDEAILRTAKSNGWAPCP